MRNGGSGAARTELPPLWVRSAAAGELARLPAIETDADARFSTVGYGFCLELPCLDAVYLERARDQGLLRVAERDGSLVGFACGWRLDAAAHLGELAVVSARQGQGIGTALLAAFEAAARDQGFTRVSLTTYADVAWNAPWYARHGYTPVPAEAIAPELAALVDAERRFGIAAAPRVTMAKALQS